MLILIPVTMKRVLMMAMVFNRREKNWVDYIVNMCNNLIADLAKCAFISENMVMEIDWKEIAQG